MNRLAWVKLTRRKFLALGASLIATALAACGRGESDDDTETEELPDATPSPSPTPDAEPELPDEPTPSPTEVDEIVTPTPAPSPTPEPTPTPEPPPVVSMWIAPELETWNSELVRQISGTIETISSGQGFEFEDARSPDDADLKVAASALDSADAIIVYGEPLVAVTAPDQLVVEITDEQLRALFAGEIANWSELGGQDRDVVRATHPSADQSGFTAGEIITEPGDVVDLLREASGAIAIVPRSTTDFRTQLMIVDEVDPLREELSPDAWPYWERVSIEFGSGLDSRFRDAIAEAAEDLNEAAGIPARTMMSVIGDIMLGRTVHRIMIEQNDYLAPYRLVADELQRGDITVGNLECVITGSFSPPEDPRTFSFMTFPDAVAGIEHGGFHALSGGNNHAMDFGVVGVQDTRQALSTVGIQHFGAGVDLAQAREPAILEHDGVTFALLGYDSISMHYAGATPESGGVAPMLREYVIEDIQNAREQADVVIPYFHWGIEYVLTPQESDRRMARVAIDAGADLVLGGHPHWVQGMEIYGGKPIFYSLSNFIFDQEWSLETKQGFILHLVFDGVRFAGFRVVPVLIEDFHRPRIVEDEMRSIILGRFWESTSIIASTPID